MSLPRQLFFVCIALAIGICKIALIVICTVDAKEEPDTTTVILDKAAPQPVTMEIVATYQIKQDVMVYSINGLSPEKAAAAFKDIGIDVTVGNNPPLMGNMVITTGSGDKRPKITLVTNEPIFDDLEIRGNRARFRWSGDNRLPAEKLKHLCTQLLQ